MWLEFALIGAFAGFAAGFLGIGGGLVVVPALTWLFLRDSATEFHAVHLAVATSLATMLVGSLASILAHQRRGAIRWDVFGRFTPGLLLGAVAGAWLAARLNSPTLGMVFGAFALLMGFQLLLARAPDAQRPLPGRVNQGLVGAGIGSISAMVGIGGGSMTAPWLMWHGVRAQTSVATAAACGYPIAVAGSIFYAISGPSLDAPTLGFIHLQAFAGIAMISLFTAPLGAAAVHRLSPVLVRRLFGGVLLLLAWKMLTQG